MKKDVQKWEYRSAFIDLNLPEGVDHGAPPSGPFEGLVTGAKIRQWQLYLEQELNKLGAEGWELVCIHSDLAQGEVDDGFALFKRPRED